MIPNKDTFCVNPWLSLSLQTDNKLSPCCLIAGWNFPYQDLDKYFKSKQLNDLRKDLLNGVKNKSCDRCWYKESQGTESLRQWSNKTIKGDIRKQIENPDIEKLVNVELSLGNLCNLKCLMCKPILSSQLLAEANQHPELKPLYEKNTSYIQKHFDWPKAKEFELWCEHVLPNCTQIKFTGGEPFTIPWVPTLLKKINDDKKKQITLNIVTNLKIINHTILESFNHYKEVWLNISLEGIGSTFEYVRYGNNWQTVEGNINYIKDKKYKNLYLKVANIIQATSFHSTLELVDFCDKNNMEIFPIPLENPECFHISVLTKKCKDKFLNDTANYNGKNTKYINFVRNICKENIEQDKKLAIDCMNLLDKYDKVRNTNWRDIIPLDNLQ